MCQFKWRAMTNFLNPLLEHFNRPNFNYVIDVVSAVTFVVKQKKKMCCCKCLFYIEL